MIARIMISTGRRFQDFSLGFCRAIWRFHFQGGGLGRYLDGWMDDFKVDGISKEI